MILLVEDELAIAEAIQMSLQREGHTVVHASTARMALDTLRQSPTAYALAVLDVGLPDFDGFELCRQIRGTYSPQQLSILFLTARNDEIDRVMGLEIGGGDYMSKPFGLREFNARVRLLLKRGQATESVGDTNENDTRRWEDFSWNEGQAWVKFKQHSLSLTLSEYKLLIQFLKRPQQVFSRQQLIDISRGGNSPSGERTIDTHVKTLRGKLRQVALEADQIRTLRGIGYAFGPENQG